MPRRTFLFIMPIFLLAWFFVWGAWVVPARADAGQPAHLWHFDDCEGAALADSAGADDLPQNAIWTVGKFQCGINQPYQAQYYIDKTFASPLPAGELTLSFYWRNSAWPNGGRNHVYLKKADGAIAAGVRPSISSRILYYDGGATSTIPVMPDDNNWHLVTVTYGSDMRYYVDGIQQAGFNGNYAIGSPIASLEIRGENYPVELDELAIWSRVLSAEEVASMYNASTPLEPYTARPVQEKARLAHLWHFDENSGSTAADSIGVTALSPIVKWIGGRFGAGIEHTWQSNYLISKDLDQPIDSKDLSLDFWWKNSAYPSEGRASLELQTSAGVKVFGLRPSMSSGSLYFDGSTASISSFMPSDSQWHHLALVYDSYKFYLAFYVDGQEKLRLPKVWFRRPVTRLVIRGENWFYGLDELAVWQGVLSQEEIADYYSSGQAHSLAEPEPVILIPGILGSWNISGRWQIDPIFHTYDNLMEALIAAGYKENSLGEASPTLFTFPYDWRVDNNVTANLLKEKIAQVKEITGRDKVDIIAHSMGGLAARSYIQSDDYQNDVDQVIFLGTPHLGAVESYFGYEGAYFQGFWGSIKKYLFQIEGASQGYFDLTDYIRAQIPTVEQLLPIYNYLKDKQADNSWQLRPYPLNYPQNNYLENLNNQTGIDLLKQRAKITNIVSDLGQTSTLNYLRVVPDQNTMDNKWQSGYPENLGQNLDSLEKGNGDKTVPLFSADSLNGVEVIKTNISDHENLPTIMQKQIIKTMTDKEPTDYFNGRLISTFKRWAFFRVYSPVDFAVVAPDGKKIGKDFASNAEVNEIPDAFYSGFDSESEFVLIPNPIDGEYKVELQGVDNGGEYTLANSLIDGDKETNVQYTGAISPSIERDFTINYQASSDNPISELEPVDTAPPVVVINKPLEADKYLHSDNLVIDYTATDDFSGIASTAVMIDGELVATSTIDLFDYSLGMHKLIITATDKSGNQAQALVNFQIITDIDSAISDINEIYQRGWLTDKIHQELLKGALKLLKTEARFFDKERDLNQWLSQKTQDDSKLTPDQKQKLLEQYDKKLAELKKNRLRTVNKNLGSIIRLLDRAKQKNLINQQGYDIILSDINYLRENL